MTFHRLVELNSCIPSPHKGEQWIMDNPNQCEHTQWHQWRPVGYSTALDGLGGRREFIRIQRECVHCSFTEQQWLIDNTEKITDG